MAPTVPDTRWCRVRAIGAAAVTTLLLLGCGDTTVSSGDRASSPTTLTDAISTTAVPTGSGTVATQLSGAAATTTSLRAATPSTTSRVEPTTRSTPPPTGTRASSAALPPPVQLARQDLARRLKVAEVDVEVAEVTQTVWPDTCLGIDAPELCAPGPTSGYRVAFRVAGREYRYHTDSGALFRYAGPGDAPSYGG